MLLFIVRSGYYAAGRLEKTTVTDEDGLVTESFTDNDGKTVLTVSLNGTDRLETYSVYDALGRVRWVLPPEASHRLGAGTDTTVLNRYAYRYDYDPRGLLIEKRLPGVDPVYYVYDGKDRAVLSQDGNQRSGNRWSYTLYDSRNRATETGRKDAPPTTQRSRSQPGLPSFRHTDSLAILPLRQLHGLPDGNAACLCGDPRLCHGVPPFGHGSADRDENANLGQRHLADHHAVL